MKTVILASDHAGFSLKENIKGFLETQGFRVEDVGAHHFDENDDYPPYMAAAVRRVIADPAARCAVVFGGSGNGEAMVCNRFAGIRAAVWHGGDLEVVRLSRTHNDANVLSIGARFTDPDSAARAVNVWLSTSFSGDARHRRRIAAIETETAGQSKSIV